MTRIILVCVFASASISLSRGIRCLAESGVTPQGVCLVLSGMLFGAAFVVIPRSKP